MTHQQYLTNFKAIAEQMVALTERKNKDYANGDDAFQNFRSCEELGITTVERGILVRMTDKLQRVINLLERDAEVKEEAITDTLQDLAVYSIILLIYRQNKSDAVVMD